MHKYIRNAINIILFSMFAFAGEGEGEGSANKLGPFDKLLGEWEVKQTIRNQDGSWSERLNQYRWRFYPILQGEAIQDDWISVDSSGAELATGTNIRIYNHAENQWHMAWIDKSNRRTAVFTAKNKSDGLVMQGNNAQGREVRNTFYAITTQKFSWKQEWTFDNGTTWVEVVRLEATKAD